MFKDLLATTLSHLRFSGVFRSSAPATHLPVLMYHGIVERQLACPDWCFLKANTFRLQMEYLKRHFDVLPLAAAIESLYNDPSPRRPAAAITFDDGYRNNFSIALPILRQLGLPATVFLCTDFIDSGDTIWFCRLLDALGETQKPSLTWRGKIYNLKTGPARARVSIALQSELKRQPPDALRASLAAIFKSLDYDASKPTPFDSPFRILDSAAIRAMSDTGLVEFGAHTRSHTILSLLSRSRQRDEIQGSIARVTALTGRACRFFAYPNGTIGDYDAVASNILRNSGVLGALTAIREPNSIKTPPLEIRRFGVGANISMAEYRYMIHNPLGLGRRFVGGQLFQWTSSQTEPWPRR